MRVLYNECPLRCSNQGFFRYCFCGKWGRGVRLIVKIISFFVKYRGRRVILVFWNSHVLQFLTERVHYKHYKLSSVRLHIQEATQRTAFPAPEYRQQINHNLWILPPNTHTCITTNPTSIWNQSYSCACAAGIDENQSLQKINQIGQLR